MKSACSILAIVALAAAFSVPANAQYKLQIEPDAVEVPRGDMLIQNIDTIWTATGEILENASILIRDGIIAAIGTDLDAPGGATVIDGSGKTAIPGLVDEHSHSALPMAEVNEGTVPIASEVRVLDVLDPEHFSIYQALSGGVTTLRTLHGSANPIGGRTLSSRRGGVWKTLGSCSSRVLRLPSRSRWVKTSHRKITSGAVGSGVTRRRELVSRQSSFRHLPRLRNTKRNGTGTARTQGISEFHLVATSVWRRWRTSWKAECD